MIHTRTIGDIRLTGLIEYVGPTHDPAALYPKFDPAVLEAHRDWLVPDFWVPAMNRLVIAMQIWIVHAGSRIILVDTGIGNQKRRNADRQNLLNTVAPAWMEAAGARPDRVTDVVMTHLHNDHIGWNTTLVDGRWVPTFENARHHIPKRDFDYWRGVVDRGEATDTCIEDSLMPVVEAGLATFIEDETDILDGLFRVERAPGHTPGQLNYWLESKGEVAVFSGDIMHHPVQIVEPDWSQVVDVLPDTSPVTRRAFLAEAARTGALVMPCHFPTPHCGYVRRRGEGYVYEPAPKNMP